MAYEFYKRGEISNTVTGKNIANVWENLVEKISLFGYPAITPKDEGMGKELRSVSLKVPIKNPRTHPLFGGLASHEGKALESYIDQVVGEGSHDLGKESPFKYTYHQLLRHFGVKFPWEQGGYDQIKAIIDLIVPFKRSYQASTWRIPQDNEGDLTGGDQPCLVVLWCWLGWDTYVFKEEGEEIADFYRQNKTTKYIDLLGLMKERLRDYYANNRKFSLTLDMTGIWRNRDGGSAWLDNVAAMTVQQEYIAKMIEQRFGIPVKIGYYHEHNMAIQIYPRDFPSIEKVIKTRR
jgi:thymidylate synthase